MKMQFEVLERDDAILIASETPIEGMRTVDAIFDGALTPTNIEDDDVCMLESRDGSTLKFVKAQTEDWDANWEKWNAEGWMVIGYEMVRFYETEADYKITLDE